MQKHKIQSILFSKYHMYISINNNIKNKDFVFCCDLLKLKEYDEFEKKLKTKYWKYDNYLLIIETIDSNDLDHFKYILKFVEISDYENLLIYCLCNDLFNISDYIMTILHIKDYNKYLQYATKNGSMYYIKKYINYIDVNKMNIHRARHCINYTNISKNNSIKEFEWLFQKGLKINNELMYDVQKNKELLLWMMNKKKVPKRIISRRIESLNRLPIIKSSLSASLEQNYKQRKVSNFSGYIDKNG